MIPLFLLFLLSTSKLVNGLPNFSESLSTKIWIFKAWEKKKWRESVICALIQPQRLAPGDLWLCHPNKKPAVLEPWKKKNFFRCSVACCSEEHLSLHRDSVKCLPYRSLPRFDLCGVVWCVSLSKAIHHLIDNFERFSKKKKRKKTTWMSIQVVPGRGGRKLSGGFTWYQSRRGGLFALLLSQKQWNIQNVELDKRIMA